MQTELFELSSSSQASHAEPSAAQPTFLERNFISLRMDQAIGLFLFLLVIYVLAFSWGFGNGKKAAAKSSEPPTVLSASVQSSVSIMPTLVPETNAEEKVRSGDANDSVSKEIPISVSELPKPVAEVNKPDGKYTIQHVTYVTQSAADREAQKLIKGGQTAFVFPVGKHFIVCVASAPTRQEAAKLLKQLKTQHIVSMDAYVRSVPS